MEFYKLYFKLHRHTGWYDMMNQIDRICRPEHYEKLRKNRQKRLREFGMFYAKIDAMLDGQLTRTANMCRNFDL